MTTGAHELLPSEEWRSVPGFDGYEVSNIGAIRSWMAPGSRAGARAGAPRLLKPIERLGYVKYALRAQGSRLCSVFAHRAVLLAFVGPCPPGMEARHLNGDSRDNRLENLRWDTKRENELDKIRHGTWRTGSRSMHRKLTEAVVTEIKKRIADGDSLSSLGREYGVRWQSIQSIAKGRSWKHL